MSKNTSIYFLTLTLICSGLTSLASANEPTITLAAKHETTTRKVANVISDSAITTEIKAKHAADELVSVFEVKVETVKGVVTLSGNVHDTQTSERAESIAKAVEGVKKVVNSIKIDPNAHRSTVHKAVDATKEVMDDTAITTKIKTLHAADDLVSVLDVKVETVKGVVTLSGDVPNEETADRAASIAKSVNGVEKVVSNLNISHDSHKSVKDHAHNAKETTKEVLGDTAITTKVKAKFAADDLVKALDIHVETNKGVVVLSGHASKEASDRAESIAKNVENVEKVVNNITH